MDEKRLWWRSLVRADVTFPAMEATTEARHVRQAIAIGFIGSFACMVASLFFPVDFSGELPVYPKAALLLNEACYGLFIFASTLMGIKLADDKRVMPSAGFTMLAIAQGVAFITIFEVQHFTEEEYKKTYEIMTGMLFLFLPAMWLIARYTSFPRWLNWLGLAACVPWVVSSILFQTGPAEFKTIEGVYGAGYLLMETTALCWGIRVLRTR